ncbi:hypothetical protein D9M69_682610 [compost metagenome]
MHHQGEGITPDIVCAQQVATPRRQKGRRVHPERIARRQEWGGDRDEKDGAEHGQAKDALVIGAECPCEVAHL